MAEHFLKPAVAPFDDPAAREHDSDECLLEDAFMLAQEAFLFGLGAALFGNVFDDPDGPIPGVSCIDCAGDDVRQKDGSFAATESEFDCEDAAGGEHGACLAAQLGEIILGSEQDPA
jgi:hypothetical protein